MIAGQWGKKAADLMEEDKDSLDKEWIRNIWVSYNVSLCTNGISHEI